MPFFPTKNPFFIYFFYFFENCRLLQNFLHARRNDFLAICISEYQDFDFCCGISMNLHTSIIFSNGIGILQREYICAICYIWISNIRFTLLECIVFSKVPNFSVLQINQMWISGTLYEKETAMALVVNIFVLNNL